MTTRKQKLVWVLLGCSFFLSMVGCAATADNLNTGADVVRRGGAAAGELFPGQAPAIAIVTLVVTQILNGLAVWMAHKKGDAAHKRTDTRADEIAGLRMDLDTNERDVAAIESRHEHEDTAATKPTKPS